jgi:hypothetical protein
VELYNDLQQRIMYTEDFIFLARFSNYFFMNNSPDMRRVLSLFSYYETCYILKEMNAFNKEQLTTFKNMNYDFINSMYYDIDNNEIVINGTYDLIHIKSLTSDDDIKKYVSILKYNVNENKEFTIFSCFKELTNKDNEQCAKWLIQYLIMMKGFKLIDYGLVQTDQATDICIQNKFYKKSKNAKLCPGLKERQLLDKYNELYPICKGTNKRIWSKPEKYLNVEYKRVSRNIINIYFPSLFDKLKNIFIP